jgi:hypothetical protein
VDESIASVIVLYFFFDMFSVKCQYKTKVAELMAFAVNGVWYFIRTVDKRYLGLKILLSLWKEQPREFKWSIRVSRGDQAI